MMYNGQLVCYYSDQVSGPYPGAYQVEPKLT